MVSSTRPLVLLHGPHAIPLVDRAVAIGRFPECELILDGREISRRHARIVPTPEGPLLVDRSRYGTLHNGSRVVAPTLLQQGDRLTVGEHELNIELAEGLPGLVLPAHAGWGGRLRGWRRRYGVSEVVGTVAAVLVAVLARRWTGSVVVAAYAATLAETGWFYAVLAFRDLRRESRQGTGGSIRVVGRNLLHEFGAAEMIDSLLLRPLAIGLGLRLLGGWPGALAGKLAADLLFYGPVLALWHWRLGARATPSDDQDRRRATSARLPVLPR